MNTNLSKPCVMRDHLFISYAWEDGALAEWLVRKLTAEGFRVWCDRFKLLGGERWPKDIDKAIKERTFRMIALLSRHSLHKENPCKERQMALILSKERKEDFLIPLNVDGQYPTDLGWELSDINYIRFDDWAAGLKQLLKKLASIDAPKPLGESGRSIAAVTFLSSCNVIQEVPETLYTNCLPVTNLPEVLYRHRLSRALSQEENLLLEGRWAFYPVDGSNVLAFAEPPVDFAPNLVFSRAGGVVWRDVHKVDGIRSSDVVSNLIKRSLIVQCTSLGLIRSDDRKMSYFPSGLVPKDKIKYRSYKGKERRTPVGVLGERKVGKERVRFHLGVTFRVRQNILPGFAIELKLRLFITNTLGQPLEAKTASARRRTIAKGWWNHHWLSRQLAVVEFLSSSSGEIVIGTLPQEQIRIGGTLLTETIIPSINDDALESLRAKVKAISAALERSGDGEDASEDVEEVKL